MSKYEIVLTSAGSPVRYLYEDPARALKKVRTLQRKGTGFHIESGVGAAVSVEEIESATGPKTPNDAGPKASAVHKEPGDGDAACSDPHPDQRNQEAIGRPVRVFI